MQGFTPSPVPFLPVTLTYLARKSTIRLQPADAVYEENFNDVSTMIAATARVQWRFPPVRG
jgi:hypothetical protein